MNEGHEAGSDAIKVKKNKKSKRQIRYKPMNEGHEAGSDAIKA